MRADAGYDAVVLGAGLGGLLSAALAAHRGGRVLVLERLPYAGGRFTTVVQDGVEVTTGALHLVPHGGRGPLAGLLGDIGLRFDGVGTDVIASFFVNGRHVMWRRRWDILSLLRPRAKLDLLRIVAELKLGPRPTRPTTFHAWLRSRTRDATIERIFERFAEFALSVTLDQVSSGEMRAVFERVFRHGSPAYPRGGCKEVISRLSHVIARHGGEIALNTEAVRLITDPASHRVVGVSYRDRATGEVASARGRMVISDLGPRTTRALLEAGERDIDLGPDPTESRGLKLQLVSDRSLIPHSGIMFCLDTQRISGIVEVSNALPSVAPPGLHVLNTFQVLKDEDVKAARALARADLRYVFGPDVDRHCRVVRSSAFRGVWPVNRALHGTDTRSQQPLPGLLMVGDAYKPEGCMMVEGVAGSVRNVASLITGPAGS